MTPVNPPRTILIVEDEPADVQMLTDVLQKSVTPHAVEAVGDGESALRYLRRADACMPDLIVLDLYLPGKDGFQVLAELKSDQRLRRIPVVVLTASSRPEDAGVSYGLRANSFVRKPQNRAALENTVAQIREFWLNTVHLPLN